MNDAQTADLFERLERIEAALSKLTEPKKEAPEEWMSYTKAAEITGFTIGTLRVYACNGSFTTSKIGKHRLINRDSLLKFIARNARKSIREQVEERLKN